MVGSQEHNLEFRLMDSMILLLLAENQLSLSVTVILDSTKL